MSDFLVMSVTQGGGPFGLPVVVLVQPTFEGKE